jgi:dihydroorotase-like cyclic amidohydrolase
LTLVAPDCYERLGTRAQMNPPVRSADHRDGIWYGIEQGIIDAAALITRRIRWRKRRRPIWLRRRA